MYLPEWHQAAAVCSSACSTPMHVFINVNHLHIWAHRLLHNTVCFIQKEQGKSIHLAHMVSDELHVLTSILFYQPKLGHHADVQLASNVDIMLHYVNIYPVCSTRGEQPLVPAHNSSYNLSPKS